MSAPYGYDLRKKVIAAVKRGEPKSNVCRMLKLSRDTLDLWLNQEAETGNCQPSHTSKRAVGTKLLSDNYVRPPTLF